MKERKLILMSGDGGILICRHGWIPVIFCECTNTNAYALRYPDIFMYVCIYMVYATIDKCKT